MERRVRKGIAGPARFHSFYDFKTKLLFFVHVRFGFIRFALQNPNGSLPVFVSNAANRLSAVVCAHQRNQFSDKPFHILDSPWLAALRWMKSFTDLQAQLKHLYCGGDPERYANVLISPVGQIDRKLIVSQKDNIDRIVATLGLKEMSQSTLVRKLCTLSGHHRTRKAIFEFDKLIRSIHTIRYLRDPQLQRNVHRSLNRIEAYHQLRSVIGQVSGRKEQIGRTDLDVAVKNQCERLVANVMISYKSILLSGY